MKTNSKRFLKGSLAVLLAVIMLFSTCITGFAANVDNADTKASVDLAETELTIPSGSGNLVMFNNTLGWSNVYLYTRSTDLWNGNNGCTTSGLTAKTMTNISGTNYWYAYVSTSYKYVLFLKDKQDNYGNVWSTSASYRADYSTSRPCFTPVPWSNQNTNSTNYYSKGSWSKFDDTTTELTIPSGSGNLVIFNNTLGWSEVYFYSKSSNFFTNSNGCSTSGMTGTLMTNISGTNYWYIYTSTTSHMLFLKDKQDGYGNVWNTAAVYKEDYNTDRQIFTPSTTAVETTNSTSYYSNGTWSKYAPAATKYTVEFVDYDGRVISTQEVEEGKTPTAPANPTREGYTFAGWSPTVGTITGDTTYTATYTQNTYALTISESGATGGTFTIDNAAFTSGNNVTHGEHALKVTAPTGYKITSINGTAVGATTGTATINVTAATTINVVYEANNKCSTSFGDTSTMNLVLGGEGTRTATLSHCTSGGTVSYSSSDTTVATVDANGKVKALKAGTTTITAECSNGDEGSSATYTVKVNNPTFTVANVNVDVNGTVTAVPTITANEPAGTYSYKFTSHSSNDDYYAVNETTGVITGQKPTTSCLVSVALMYKNTSVATASFSVKVNEPEVSLNKDALNLLTSQTAKLSVTSTPAYKSVAYSVDSVVTVGTDGTVSTTATTGTGNVTATVKYNDYYTETLTCAVTVASPTLTVSPETLNLEIGGGTTTGTVTVTNNDTAGADGTDAVAPVLAVTSSEPDVATATVVNGGISVTAKAVGTTTLTVSYRNVTKTVTVNVSQYDPYVYLYVTDSQDWDNMFLHSWKGSNSNVTTLGQSDAQMIYIGKNGDGDKIFAYRFLKGSEPEKVIMVKQNSWPSDNLTRTDDFTVDFSKGYAALYIDSTTNGSGRRNTGVWTDDCMIVRPTVSVDDLTVVIGETGTAEATVSNGDKVLWTIDDTTYATVADVDTQTATVTSVAPGTTEISARAFVDTANSSIKTLPTNYKTDTACWPFISTEATATVTVDPGSARQIKVAASYSNNGTGYNTGVTGGTVNATYESQSGTSLEVPYNGEYTITATPKTGYVFNGWTKNNEDIEGDATLTVAAKDDANYVAKFVKTYTVTVATPQGIDSIKINNAPGTTYTAKAGETITVYGSPADGYRLGDWTVTGTATATGTNTATATISNIQSNITVTPSAVKIYTVTYDQYVNRVNADVGTVTVNSSTDNDQEFDAGTEVTLVATSTNRSFYGWYAADDTNFENPLSTDATYTFTLNDNVDIVAMFYRPFTIEGNVPGSQVVLTYDIVTDTYTGTSNGYTGNAFTVKDTFGNTANAADVNVTGGTHTGASVTGNANGYTLVPDTENYDTSAPITYTMRHMGIGTYYLDIALSDAEKVAISVNGTKVADKAIGSTFRYEITAPAGQYLASVTTTPAVTASIDGNTVTFTVPNSNVNIVPTFANYSYVNISDSTGITATGLKTGYKIGEAVVITLAPANTATTVTDVVTDYDGAVVAEDGDNWTVTIATMPADTTITITPTTEAKFAMNSQQLVVGNFDTGVTSYGTVTMSIGNTTLAEGGYADKEETVTYTATATSDYTFVGFYSDEAHTKLLTTDPTYEVVPTADTTIYALFARKHYISFDGWSTRTEMTYDVNANAYKYESSDITSSTAFKVTNKLSETDNYHTFDGSQFSVDLSGSKGASVSWGSGNNNWYVNPIEGVIPPVTIYVSPTSDNSIQVYARADKVGSIVYLSSGRTNIGNATTNLTTEGLTTESSEVGHEGDSEKYQIIKLTDDQSISWETEIGGTNPEYTYIDKYIVYKIETGTWEIIAPVTLGNNKYSGSVFVDGDCYIYPVYFHTDAYREATGYIAIEMYFDASAIQNLKWGPFVSCYAWNTDKSEKFFGSWPGQLLIPTADGKSFYTVMDVPPATAAKPAAGVTFNNYMFATCPTQHNDVFGVTSSNVQTYDYREPITLYEAGNDVITFVAKQSADGYHGNSSDGSATVKTVSSSTTNIFSTYTFDYLYSRDGVTPMDFNGDVIENPVVLSTGAKADYYVISKGDVIYNSGDYSADTNYNGEWSVEWYIFDSTGAYKTKVLSTALYHDNDDNDRTVLLEALGLTKEQVAGKTVAISYEHSNNAPQGSNSHPSSHQLAYDGQWYGNMLDDTVTGQVKVGFQATSDSPFEIDDDETPNVAEYGEAYLLDADGNGHQTLEIEIEYGVADIKAVVNDGYHFVGWYTQKADGSFVEVSKKLVDDPYINMNETYYAIFRPIAEGEVVINHLTYINDDPDIISHNGVAEMSIEVIAPDGTTTYTATPSTSRTSVSFEGIEDDTPYTIKIYTKPLMNGTFWAWYTDSEDENGNKTYEEVFTKESDVGSKTQVVAEFEYWYSPDSQKVINIYSDVTRVSNYATLLYKYRNRYNQTCTYTVKDIKLTDDECLGYEGNYYKEYCPTYRTEYTFEIGNEKVNVFEGTDAYNDYIEEDLVPVDSYNMVQAYAPNANVTEAFDQLITWEVSDTQFVPSGSVVTLNAVQTDNIYEVKCTYPDPANDYELTTKPFTGPYNTLTKITAPLTKPNPVGGDPLEFSYWKNRANDQIVSYSPYYNYRIIEDLEIVAVYGEVVPDWTPVIEDVTYTREFQDASDKVYVDFFLAFHNKDGKVLNDVKDGEEIKYGLIMVYDHNYLYNGEVGGPNFLEPSDTDLEKSAKYGKNAVINGTRFYNFDLTDKELTNFNRCDYFKWFDNTQENNKKYAYSCYAYLIDGNGTVYLSERATVNFYELGNEAVQTQN